MPDFKPMLAHSKSPDPATLSYPVLVQPKLDGIRAVVKDGRLLSRSLKPIPNASIRAALEHPVFEGLDGELIVGPPTAADCYRRTCSFVMAEDKTEEPWTFYVFDVHDSKEPVEDRVIAAGRRGRAHAFIELVTTMSAGGPDELAELEAGYLAAGYEGGIIRTLGSAYKFGRSGKKGPLLKLKRYIDYEAEVVGVVEEQHNGNEAKTNELGRTERSSHAENKVGKGTLGALIVKALNGPHEGVEFKVGTGFTAAVREELWERRDLEGRVAKIKSFPVGTKDRPRHPVWLGWRDLEVDG